MGDGVKKALREGGGKRSLSEQPPADARHAALLERLKLSEIVRPGQSPVRSTREPCVLRRDGENLALLMPPPRPRRKAARGRPLTEDDPLFGLIGIGDRGIEGGVSGKKHEYLARAYRQYTTNALLIEAHALLLSVLGNRAAYQFLREMDRGTTTIIRVRASDEERAKEILGRYADKDFSFNDAISFTVMERLGMTAAFTFDRDFAQYGLSILQAEEL